MGQVHPRVQASNFPGAAAGVGVGSIATVPQASNNILGVRAQPQLVTPTMGVAQKPRVPADALAALDEMFVPLDSIKAGRSVLPLHVMSGLFWGGSGQSTFQLMCTTRHQSVL